MFTQTGRKIRTPQCCRCSIKPVTLETYGRQIPPFIGAACKTNSYICTDQLGRRHKYDQPPHTACAAISSTQLINSYKNKVIWTYTRIKDTQVVFKMAMLLLKLTHKDVAKRKPHNETHRLFYRFPAIPLWRNTQITYVNVGSVVDREVGDSRYFLDGLFRDEIQTMDRTRGKKETWACSITSGLTWDAKDQYHNPHV